MPTDVCSRADESPDGRLSINPHLHQSRLGVPCSTDGVPHILLVVKPVILYPFVPNVGHHLFPVVIPENQKVVEIGGCGQRKQGMASFEVSQGP